MTNTYKIQITEYIKNAISNIVEDNTFFDTKKILSSIEVPPDSKLGDFSSTISFDLSKVLKKTPALIAKELVESINLSINSTATNQNTLNLFKKTEVAGLGYINFFLDFEKFAKITIQNAVKEKFAPKPTQNPQTVLIESPSVNPGKPLHIGHARNAVLGMIISNVFESLGNKVIRMDYIDDLGLQVAQTVWGYQNLNDQPDPDMKLDQWQGIQYVEVAKKMSDEKIKSEVDAIMNKMEQGKNKTATYANKIAMASVNAQKITTQRLNFYPDVLIKESDLVQNKIVENAIDALKKHGSVVFEDNGPNKGCFVVKLGHLDEFKGMDNPDKILVRSNGTTTYTGKDIGFHMWKFGLIDTKLYYKKYLIQNNGKVLWSSVTGNGDEKIEFNSVDKVINVIGSEQKYPQKIVKTALKSMGFSKIAKNIHHLAYEFVVLPNAKISGRKGTWAGISADDVLNEAVKRVKQIINERENQKPNTQIYSKELEEISEKVGVGAVIFTLAKVNPEKKIVFKWKDVLSFEGDSGPYLQYACVRAKKILSKAINKNISIENISSLKKFNATFISSDVEFNLVKKINKFQEIVEKTTFELKTNLLTEYATELASAFSSFYNQKQVLNTNNSSEIHSRLALVLATKNTLEATLKILGIEIPKKM